MELKGNSKTFFDAVMNGITEITIQQKDDVVLQQELVEAMRNTILDLDEPKTAQPRPDDKGDFLDGRTS